MTAYPNAGDYINAVQDPARAFLLPALQQADFETHPVLGIPMPASGEAAVVFKAAVGGVDTALRFFIREDASSRARYTALGGHFASHQLADCVASARWVDDAITVRGATWPMIQMSWVDGRTLDAYVEHLARAGDVGALSYLAATWRALVGRLQGAEFAHGDLQHGNVLVDSSSTLRLVDFDGSWIAQFAGEAPPKETGHPNYQRTGREWGRWMDTFPGLVIYTALLALSRQPASWSELRSEDKILFSAEDFTPPFRTPIWRVLAAIGDGEVDHAAERLMRACDPAWRAADTLETVLTARARSVAGAPPAAAAPRFGGPGPATPWWERVDSTQPPAATGAAVPPPPAGGAMPPPPAKSATDPSAQGPSFGGAGGRPRWYPEGGRPATPPTDGARPGGSRRRWLLLLAVFAGLVLVGGAGAAGGGGAAVGALAVVLVVLVWIVRRD